MADATPAAAKPSSSVKLVLLGEAAVGKVRLPSPRFTLALKEIVPITANVVAIRTPSPPSCSASSTMISKRTKNPPSAVRTRPPDEPFHRGSLNHPHTAASFRPRSKPIRTCDDALTRTHQPLSSRRNATSRTAPSSSRYGILPVRSVSLP